MPGKEGAGGEQSLPVSPSLHWPKRSQRKGGRRLELSGLNQWLLHLFRVLRFSTCWRRYAQTASPIPQIFIVFFMVPAGIIGCSDIASVLWMSPVAKKQTPEVSLNTQLHKSTFLLNTIVSSLGPLWLTNSWFPKASI